MTTLKPVIPDSTQAQMDKLASVNPKDRAKIHEVSEQFESIFLNLMLKSMRDTVHSSGLMDGGNAEDIYRSMLDGEYAQQMAHQRQSGIANSIEKFILDSLPKENQGPQGLQADPKQVTIDHRSSIKSKIGTIYGNKTR